MPSGTIPAMGSVTAVRPASMGVATCVIATRNTTTSTSLETIRAIRNVTHFPIHPLVTSHDAPDSASGARTTVTRIRALRMSRENQTMPMAAIIRPARKIDTIAPTPGAAIFSPASAWLSRRSWLPIDSVVSPAAWMRPMHSWSTISSGTVVNVMTTKLPRIDLPAPSAARERAPGSRWIIPVMSWRKKKIAMTNRAIPKTML